MFLRRCKSGSQYDATFGFRNGHVSWLAISNGGDVDSLLLIS